MHQVHAPEIELTSPTTAPRHLGSQRRRPAGARAEASTATVTITRPTRRSTASGASRGFDTDPPAHRLLQSASFSVRISDRLTWCAAGKLSPPTAVTDRVDTATPRTRVHFGVARAPSTAGAAGYYKHLSKHFSSTRLLIRQPSAVCGRTRRRTTGCRRAGSAYLVESGRRRKHIGLKQMVREDAVSPSMRTSKFRA